jgi:hypothetical protein
MSWPWLILIPRGLPHINLFLQCSMQEDILHVKLPKTPNPWSGQGQDKMNGSWFHHRTECVTVIYAIMLSKPFRHQTRLVSIHWGIMLPLDFVHPLAVNYVAGTRFQVLFRINASYSSSIAFLHFSLFIASVTDSGSPDDAKHAYRIVPSVYTFDFLMLFCDQVLGGDMWGCGVGIASVMHLEDRCAAQKIPQNPTLWT